MCVKVCTAVQSHWSHYPLGFWDEWDRNTENGSARSRQTSDVVGRCALWCPTTSLDRSWDVNRDKRCVLQTFCSSWRCSKPWYGDTWLRRRKQTCLCRNLHSIQEKTLLQFLSTHLWQISPCPRWVNSTQRRTVCCCHQLKHRQHYQNRHKYPIKFTDSKSHSSGNNNNLDLKQWTRNRVVEALRFINTQHWKYIRSEDMIAD